MTLPLSGLPSAPALVWSCSRHRSASAPPGGRSRQNRGCRLHSKSKATTISHPLGLGGSWSCERSPSPFCGARP
eukprot:9495760-Pyramimonas_sp.AAC.1